MATEGVPGFFEIAFERSVRRRALKIAAIVGCLIALINHGDRLLTMDLTGVDVIKIVATFLVPYCVSTYSSVQAVRERARTM